MRNFNVSTKNEKMKYILTFALYISALSALAQSTTPLPSGMDKGGVLSLEQLKDSARQNNIAMQRASLDMQAAQHQRKEAWTKFFPNVSLSGFTFNANRGMAKMNMNPSEMIPPELGAVMAQSFPPEALASLASPISMTMMKSGTIASLTAVQPVYAGGQIVNGNKLARIGEDVSLLQRQLSEREVEKTVEQYYWQVVSLQEKMKTLNAVDALLADLHKDVDVAVRAGVALPADRLKVQLRQNETESQRLTLRNALSMLKLVISQYCGLRDTSFTISAADSYTWQTPQAAITEGDKQNSLQRLPEYQLLGKQVEATDLQTKMEIGKQLPTVAVGAGYNYHNLLDNDRTFAMVFATVSIPISDWWGGSYAVKRKKIEQRKAADQLADNTELLKIRMQKAWNDLNESIQQLDVAQRGIEQAEENLRLNRNCYQAGTARMSDLLEAQLLYQQTMDRRTDAYANYRNKLLEYKQATGQ